MNGGSNRKVLAAPRPAAPAPAPAPAPAVATTPPATAPPPPTNSFRYKQQRKGETATGLARDERADERGKISRRLRCTRPG